MKLKCQNCGRENNENAKFCRYCGTILKREIKEENITDENDFEVNFFVDKEEEAQEVEEDDVEEGWEENSKEKKGRKLIGILGVVIGILLIFWIILGADYILNQRVTIFDWFLNKEEVYSENTTDESKHKEMSMSSESQEIILKESNLQKESLRMSEKQEESKTQLSKEQIETKSKEEKKQTIKSEEMADANEKSTASEVIPSEVTIDNITYRILESGAELIQCSNQSDRIQLPETIQGVPLVRIGDHSFDGCSNLLYIDIPEGVIELGSYAFWDCTNIVYMVLPDSLQNVVDWALNSPNINFICHQGTFAQQYADKYVRPWIEGDSLPLN
ncbi:Double zinc ribbon [Clostridiales bacterium CHKCI001]|nr:Double zinc ribbon [Clostridiales bacterium CHKCI001]